MPRLVRPTASASPLASRRSASAASEAGSLERYVIPNLRNACDILKLLAQQTDGLKAAEIARTLKLPVTTTLRIMATLQLEGFVRKVDTRFELGPVLIHLGNVSLAGTEIREAALPILQQLSTATDETSHLAIPCADHALIVAVQDSPHPLRAASRPGSLTELHCSSTGKIFIAFLHAQRLEEMYGKGRLTKRTDRTQDTLAEIKREAALTQKRGYSLDDEEFNLGVRCCAAPIFSSDGTAVAALGITAATVRFTRERIPELSEIVTSSAAELSRRLGYQGGR